MEYVILVLVLAASAYGGYRLYMRRKAKNEAKSPKGGAAGARNGTRTQPK